jgi:hypothetical protein
MRGACPQITMNINAEAMAGIALGGPSCPPVSAPAGAHEGRPYKRAAPPTASNKSPARSPVRSQLAQFASFNFPNNLICEAESSAQGAAKRRASVEPIRPSPSVIRTFAPLNRGATANHLLHPLMQHPLTARRRDAQTWTTTFPPKPTCDCAFAPSRAHQGRRRRPRGLALAGAGKGARELTRPIVLLDRCGAVKFGAWRASASG